MAGYSGTPLVKKIGIKAGHRVMFVDPPNGFEKSLGELPELGSTASGALIDVLIVFGKSASRMGELLRNSRHNLAKNGMVWAAWPKKASGVATDLVEDRVRELGLAAGLVDVKVCAIDDTWSGLKFVIRLADRVKSQKAAALPARSKKAAAK